MSTSTSSSSSSSSGLASKGDDLLHDLGNLCAFDTHPIDSKKLERGHELYLHAISRDNVQLLVSRLFQLEREESDAGPLAVLPAPETPLPREMPVPVPRPETRWEQYAKSKGIQKKKRDRMVFDEEKKEWAPTWGYKRAKDDTKDWAIPITGSMDPFADHFAVKKMEKKGRVLKNREQQVKNQARAAGVPAASRLSVPTLGERAKGRTKLGFGKEGGKSRLALAQRSTASMGKFDKFAKDEKILHTKGKKQKRLPTASSSSTEKNRDLGILSKVLGGEGASGRVISRGAGGGGDGEGSGGRRGRGGRKKSARR